MRWIYLIRHGQAGTRDDYDALSDLGTEQSKLLGEYFAAQGIRFDAVYAGELIRQQRTAAAVLAALPQAPTPVMDRAWNEFDLDGCYRELAPRLCADDPEFRSEFEAMRVAARDPSAAIHRQWTKCDIAVVRAWIRNRYPFQGETWEDFQDRVKSSRQVLAAQGEEAHVAVFTSATPASIWVANSLAVDGRHILRLAAALYNTAITVLRVKDGEFSLFSFNGVPHLADARLRTFR